MTSNLRSACPWATAAPLLAAVAAATGCRSATEPGAAAYVVATAESPSVRATRDASTRVTWAQFRVSVALRNDGVRSVYLPPCSTTLERQTTGGWRTAWSPICALTGGVPGTELAAGATLRVPLTVYGAVAGPGAPEFLDGVVAGRYRVTFAVTDRAELATSDGGPVRERVRSTEFEVVE